jgi:hypothetical protein
MRLKGVRVAQTGLVFVERMGPVVYTFKGIRSTGVRAQPIDNEEALKVLRVSDNCGKHPAVQLDGFRLPRGRIEEVVYKAGRNYKQGDDRIVGIPFEAYVGLGRPDELKLTTARTFQPVNSSRHSL